MQDQNIRHIVLNKLEDIQKAESITVLYAVESGSRGWGFESPDSDYDVRFIYAHPLDWYLSIEEGRDVIEYPISENLDVNGWDIQKALKLFKASNPPLYEWLQSPIVYLKQGSLADDLIKLIPKFYSPTSLMYHYLHMAQGNYKDYMLEDKVKFKKYFYCLRPIFACLWIKKYKSVPPMEFEKMLNALDLNQTVIAIIKDLLERKRTSQELGVADKISELDEFMQVQLQDLETYIKALPRETKSEIGILDNIFRKTLKSS